jgi:hypothetical protein
MKNPILYTIAAVAAIAIVALNYDEDPGLGLRWFWDHSGYPLARQYAAWMILPKSVSKALLKVGAFGLSPERICLLQEFLDGRISSTELIKRW